MPAVTDGATGTVAGVRNPAGKEPAEVTGGGAAIAMGIWTFGRWRAK